MLPSRTTLGLHDHRLNLPTFTIYPLTPNETVQNPLLHITPLGGVLNLTGVGARLPLGIRATSPGQSTHTTSLLCNNQKLPHPSISPITLG
jgi:hypothetical protein